MTGPRLELATALVALAAVALGAGLEGGTEPRMGAVAFVVALVAGLLAILPGELPKLPRRAVLLLVVLAALVLVQIFPIPHALRALIAPGQAARLDRVAGTLAVDKPTWLSALTVFDVDVLLEKHEPYAFDVLAGAQDGWRTLTLSPSAWVAQAGQWGACAVLVLVGWRLGRTRGPLLTFLIGMVALGVFEAFFGFSNRNGPSTGIGTKLAYLGSATGTFINRGHFAAFLNLSLGALWGLAASLFPLLPEEVRKHAQRKRRSSQPPGILEASGDKVPRLVLLTFTTAVLFVGMVAANSRGPLVALVVAGLGIGVWTRVRRGDGVHLGLGVGAPIAGVAFAAVALGPRGALGRFLSLGSGDVSVSSRLDLWRASVSAWVDAPVFGAGAGSWRLAFAPHELGVHLYDPGHAHSEPLELLVELGLAGTLLAAGLLFWLGRGVAQRLDVVEHDLRSSVAVGVLVPLVAIGLQSLADFPLRTPGVAIPFAIYLGILVSTLDLGEATGRRLPGLLVGALALVAIGWTGLRDAELPGTRSARLSEMAPFVALPRPKEPEAQDAVMAAACGAARREPYDAWRQAACAVAAARVSLREGTADEAQVADAAVMRAIELHPRDPRIRVVAASVWARLREPTLLENAFTERATEALAYAVNHDGWRAEEAFDVARTLPAESIDRIGQAAAAEPVSRSRALYQYGVVVEELGHFEPARSIQEDAASSDPQFGPPAFRAGLLAEKAGDAEDAQRWFRAFLAARDRPTAMEGWTLVKLGEMDAAEVRFRRAVAANPKNRWAWEGLAAVAAGRADRADEREAWRRVLDITPADPTATRRLKELGE